MKKIIFGCFLAIFFITSCEHEQISEELMEDASQDTGSQEFIFSGNEVNKMILE